MGHQKVVDCQQQARKWAWLRVAGVSSCAEGDNNQTGSFNKAHTHTPTLETPTHCVGQREGRRGGRELCRSEGIRVIHLPSLDNGCSRCGACSMLKPAKKLDIKPKKRYRRECLTARYPSTVDLNGITCVLMAR